ncbi:hypothetical protein F4802DRAFT_576622 [Xylaria palmicola]|nr:hypothetical protein F4802DRAFT_576622 [Xylaria palmicola]
MDDNWDIKSLTGADLSRAITAIHLIAYPSPSRKDDDEPFPQTNHWCFFLDFGDNTSVRLEVTPGRGGEGLRCQVRLTSKTHACTTNNLRKITYDMNPTVTLNTLVLVAQTNGRQKYEFARGWEGCRYWNYVFIQDLETCKILPQGAANQASEAMSWFYHTVHGAEKRPLKTGTFCA